MRTNTAEMRKDSKTWEMSENGEKIQFPIWKRTKYLTICKK